MRLPRRVPWASPAELDQVCSWIFTDQHDLDAKDLAVSRLSAWKAVTSLPHALECTLALLVVLQQDRRQENTPGSPLNHLSLRHSYASAIIRLVNGLVDPLQLGAYARSIASIASQLGLPSWLVELRHAATHEDLPSLEVLREAAQQSMAWLLHNYFLPTINPASASQKGTPSLRPLSPTLKRYKSMMKIVTRDASLRTRYRPAILATTRDIERWVAEAKVAADISNGDVGWGTDGDTPGAPQTVGEDDHMSFKEKWALERLCDILLEKGGLVPLSKKKRTFPENKFWPPTNSVSLWSPLIKHMQMLHTGYAHTLCARIIATLFSGQAAVVPSSSHLSDEVVTLAEVDHDLSYYMCLARWAVWLVDNRSDLGIDSEMGDYLKRDVTETLMKNLGHCLRSPDLGEKAAYVQNFSSRRIVKPERSSAEALRAICFQESWYGIAVSFMTGRQELAPKDWIDQDMATMKDRLTQVQLMTEKQIKPVLHSESGTARGDAIETTRIDVLPTGWQQVNSTCWRPCPIGVFHKSTSVPA